LCSASSAADGGAISGVARFRRDQQDNLTIKFAALLMSRFGAKLTINEVGVDVCLAG
jgi:hypothetical protein